MALQECPDCGAQISNQATTCIKCGCPLIVKQSKNIESKKEQTVIFHEIPTTIKVEKEGRGCLGAIGEGCLSTIGAVVVVIFIFCLILYFYAF